MEKTEDIHTNSFKQDYQQLIEEVESLHGFQINETLGEGSFGVVLSATRQVDHKKFALKLYKEPFKT